MVAHTEWSEELRIMEIEDFRDDLNSCSIFIYQIFAEHLLSRTFCSRLWGIRQRREQMHQP